MKPDEASLYGFHLDASRKQLNEIYVSQQKPRH